MPARVVEYNLLSRLANHCCPSASGRCFKISSRAWPPSEKLATMTMPQAREQEPGQALGPMAKRNRTAHLQQSLISREPRACSNSLLRAASACPALQATSEVSCLAGRASHVSRTLWALCMQAMRVREGHAVPDLCWLALLSTLEQQCTCAGGQWRQPPPGTITGGVHKPLTSRRPAWFGFQAGVSLTVQDMPRRMSVRARSGALKWKVSRCAYVQAASSTPVVQAARSNATREHRHCPAGQPAPGFGP